MSDHVSEQTLFSAALAAAQQDPVECLGMTFENDEKRREYFLEKLREKLKDPEFRQTEGFPIGSDAGHPCDVRSPLLYRLPKSVS